MTVVEEIRNALYISTEQEIETIESILAKHNVQAAVELMALVERSGSIAIYGIEAIPIAISKSGSGKYYTGVGAEPKNCDTLIESIAYITERTKE